MLESPARPVWWLPTFGFFLFLAIELWIFLGCQNLFQDPGVGRHLRTAEFIVETGQIPRADPLSFTRAGEPWLDFEWAFEATLGELYRAGGLGLICAFCFALFATTVLGIYRTLLQTGLPVGTVMMVTGVAFLTLHLHFSARPVLFTYLFMALVVEVWRRQATPRARDWLLLPVVFAAWANLHAGWAAALVFLGLSLAGRAIDRITRRTDGDESPLIPWIGLTSLCSLAVMLNPWGFHLLRQTFLFATTYKSFALWDEYRPPDFLDLRMSAVAILFIVGIVFLARLCRQAPVWRWEVLLPVLFFLDEGLKAQRHVILLMIIAAVPVGRDLAALLAESWLPSFRDRFSLLAEALELIGGRLREFQATQREAGGDAWLAAVAAVGISWLFLISPFARPHWLFVGNSITPKLVDFVRDHPDRFQRPLTTTWNAGPLLWNARPDFRVSFDDRGDFYGDKTVFAFVDLYDCNAGWQDKLAQGNYDSALLDRHLRLNQFITTVPGWTEVYCDDKTVVYWNGRNAAGTNDTHSPEAQPGDEAGPDDSTIHDLSGLKGETPIQFLTRLQQRRYTFYTFDGPLKNWITQKDLPALLSLTGSKAPCSSVVLLISNQLPTQDSTVGQEALFMIEGYRKGEYPPSVASFSPITDSEELMQWAQSQME